MKIQFLDFYIFFFILISNKKKDYQILPILMNFRLKTIKILKDQRLSRKNILDENLFT